MHSLVIFASGAGSNAKAIIEYFKKAQLARVSLIVCNKPQAGVLQIAADEQIPVLMIDKELMRKEEFLQVLIMENPSLIILAGFLWKVPDAVTQHFNNKIINIHPALLPKYGGKNMYGSNVHKAVVAAGEKESGITIHYVNEQYDEGNMILQAHCEVKSGEDDLALARRIHQLEHFYFPRTIAFLLSTL
ncbi:MAG TPA: phosphoribosylglycinamide formyltransferase [Flavipsychrobacter sp.]|nr:phosphoribosylglycinamide formyltransferase [Flavipsychrobacter sp.]